MKLESNAPSGVARPISILGSTATDEFNEATNIMLGLDLSIADL